MITRHDSTAVKFDLPIQVGVENRATLNARPEELTRLLHGLLGVLSAKERYVITHRYALEGRPHTTLARIGRHFGVTRERIRQVEKYALGKLQRASKERQLVLICEFVKELLAAHGGLQAQDRVINEVDRFLPHVSATLAPELKLIICLDHNIVQVGNTVNYHPHFRLYDFSFSDMRCVSKSALSTLNRRKILTPVSTLVNLVQDDIGYDHAIFKGTFVKACLELDKRIKIQDGEVSLYEWRHVNPRTLRDKIQYVLSSANRPLHFMDIVEEIGKYGFDKRTVSLQAVHNELINCDDFVLIGRGIYALISWGYEKGTVSDVIAQVLEEDGSMYADQLIERVLSRRQVKRVTISVNLKNRDLFKKLPDGRYALV